MRSPIYWNAALYRFTLRTLYGSALDERFSAVVQLLGNEGSVLDLCAGDGAIAAHLPRGIRYVPADANEAFVAHLQRKGFAALNIDVRTAVLPEADVVLMMGSLYHMVPHHAALVERMKGASKRRTILVEPHVNWSKRSGLLGKLAQAMSDPGIEGSHLGRLSADDLDKLAVDTKATRVINLARERILVWDHT